MRNLFLAVAVISLLATSFSSAKDCGALNTQMEINACASENFTRADAALNAAYGKLTAKVTADGKSKLVEAQRAWIKYRDAQCDFETLGTVGGSIHPFEVAECKTEFTREQTKRLQRQLTCEEGDLSCGGQ